MNGESNRETIVLLHGFAAHSLTMTLLGRRLLRPSSRIVNWGYFSYFRPIETYAEALAQRLRELDDDAACDRIHVVGHSMGGIVARTALAAYRPRKFGRLVMLASPNRGSHAANFLDPWLGRIFTPIRQLRDCDDSFVRCLPPPEGLEIGIISATRDYIVRPEQARLDIAHEHCEVAALHSEMLIRRETADQVRRFLDCGRFGASVSAS